MSAAGRVHGNLRLAVGAGLCLRGGGLLLLLTERHELVYAADKAEENESHNDEVDDRRQKRGGKARHVGQGITRSSGNDIENRIDEILGQ